MQVFLLLSLLVAALAVIFAIQNTEVVTVDFLVWSFQGSLALILLVALAAGAIASSLASLPSMFRAHRLGGVQRHTIDDLRAEIVKLKDQLEHTKAPAPPPAESGRDQLA